MAKREQNSLQNYNFTDAQFAEIKRVAQELGLPTVSNDLVNALRNGRPPTSSQGRPLWGNTSIENDPAAQQQLVNIVQTLGNGYRETSNLQALAKAAKDNPTDKVKVNAYNTALKTATAPTGALGAVTPFLQNLGLPLSSARNLFSGAAQAGYQINETAYGQPPAQQINFITPGTRQGQNQNLLPTPESSLIGRTPSQGGLENMPRIQPLLPQPQVNPGITAGQNENLLPFPTIQPQPLISSTGSAQVPIAGSTDVPTVRRDIPGYIDPTTDRALVEQEAVRQQDQAKAIAEAQSQAYLQAIAQYQQGLSGLRPTIEQEAQRQFQQNVDASGIQQQILRNALGNERQNLDQIRPLIEQEGARQYEQSTTLANQQDQARQQRLTDLGSLLNQRQSTLFQRATPLLAEQAQTAGLLQSSGFGEALARNYGDLTADTQYQLAQQGISDRDALLQAQQQALSQRQGFQGYGLDQGVANIGNTAQQQFTIEGLPAQQLETALTQRQQLQNQGLGQNLGVQQDVAGKLFGAEENRIQNISDILGRRQQLQLSGLQREFSVKDLEESARLAQQYGLQMAPQSGGGGSPFGSLLGGAATGAALGSVIPGVGTAIGAGVGAVGGLLGGGKKGK